MPKSNSPPLFFNLIPSRCWSGHWCCPLLLPNYLSSLHSTLPPCITRVSDRDLISYFNSPEVFHRQSSSLFPSSPHMTINSLSPLLFYLSYLLPPLPTLIHETLGHLISFTRFSHSSSRRLITAALSSALYGTHSRLWINYSLTRTHSLAVQHVWQQSIRLVIPRTNN